MMSCAKDASQTERIQSLLNASRYREAAMALEEQERTTGLSPNQRLMLASAYAGLGGVDAINFADLVNSWANLGALIDSMTSTGDDEESKVPGSAEAELARELLRLSKIMDLVSLVPRLDNEHRKYLDRALVVLSTSLDGRSLVYRALLSFVQGVNLLRESIAKTRIDVVPSPEDIIAQLVAPRETLRYLDISIASLRDSRVMPTPEAVSGRLRNFLSVVESLRDALQRLQMLSEVLKALRAEIPQLNSNE